MRFVAAGTATVIAQVLGFQTWEALTLGMCSLALGLGIVNFVRIGRQATAIKELQDQQGRRIDELRRREG